MIIFPQEFSSRIFYINLGISLNMFATLVGIHPRTEELVKASREYERGRITEEEYKTEVENCINRIIDEQKKLGFKQITDGMIKWDDIFRPFSRVLNGVTAGSLTRFFDNNTFYRKLEIKGKIEYRGGFLNYVSRKSEKVIVPGLYTFAELSHNEYYKEKLDLMWDYFEALKAISLELKRSEISFLQLNEPSIVYRYRKREISEDEIRLIASCFKDLKRILNTSIHLYFGDCSRAAHILAEEDVEPIGIDMIETEPESVDYIPAELVLGVVDSRNTFMEDPHQIADMIRKFRGRIAGISPNCDLEFLPYEQARRKMEILREALEVL
jgi:5-methyltetrahydropteroyltriglutamate--homocysteine methyltransferase